MSKFEKEAGTLIMISALVFVTCFLMLVIALIKGNWLALYFVGADMFALLVIRFFWITTDEQKHL